MGRLTDSDDEQSGRPSGMQQAGSRVSLLKTRFFEIKSMRVFCCLPSLELSLPLWPLRAQLRRLCIWSTYCRR